MLRQAGKRWKRNLERLSQKKPARMKSFYPRHPQPVWKEISVKNLEHHQARMEEVIEMAHWNYQLRLRWQAFGRHRDNRRRLTAQLFETIGCWVHDRHGYTHRLSNEHLGKTRWKLWKALRMQLRWDWCSAGFRSLDNREITKRWKENTKSNTVPVKAKRNQTNQRFLLINHQ